MQHKEKKIKNLSLQVLHVIFEQMRLSRYYVETVYRVSNHIMDYLIHSVECFKWLRDVCNVAMEVCKHIGGEYVKRLGEVCKTAMQFCIQLWSARM